MRSVLVIARSPMGLRPRRDETVFVSGGTIFGWLFVPIRFTVAGIAAPQTRHDCSRALHVLERLQVGQLATIRFQELLNRLDGGERGLREVLVARAAEATQGLGLHEQRRATPGAGG